MSLYPSPFAFITPTIVVAGPNFLVNTFETSTEGWTYEDQLAGGGTADRVAGDSHSGSYSYSFNGSGLFNGYDMYLMSPTVTCRSGEITGWYKCSTPRTPEVTVWRNGSYTRAYISNSGTWTYFSYSVPAGNCAIWFEGADYDGVGWGYMAIDDISFPIP